MSVSVNAVNLEESKKCFDSKKCLDSKDENKVQSEPTLLKDSILFGKKRNDVQKICVRRISEFPTISRGLSKLSTW